MTIETADDNHVMFYARKGGLIESNGIDEKYVTLTGNSLIILGTEMFKIASKQHQDVLVEAIKFFDGKDPTAMMTAALDVGLPIDFTHIESVCLIDNEIYKCGDYLIPLVLGRDQLGDSLPRILEGLMESLTYAMKEVMAEYRTKPEQAPTEQEPSGNFGVTETQGQPAADQFSPIVVMYSEKAHALLPLVLDPMFPATDIDPLYKAATELFIKAAHEACRRVTTNAMSNIGTFITERVQQLANQQPQEPQA